MKLLVIDFNVLLLEINPHSIATKHFEIYYDICRLLDIEISKESCFKLFTRYSENYGKLKEYLCILKRNADRSRFDEEYFRRYKQLYFNQDTIALDEVKSRLQDMFKQLSNNYIIALTATGNTEFIKYAINYFDLGKYINAFKVGEILDFYDSYIDEIFAENITTSNPPETIIFTLTPYQNLIRNFLQTEERYKEFSLQFKEWNELSS